MGDKSSIEWTNATWNPTTGCDKVSPGCDNCYALTLAPRLKAMKSAHYQTDGNPKTSGPGFGIAMHPDALDKPLRWQRPRKIFVNSMSDLFHSGVTDEFIAQVFAVMMLAQQHTFQVLTKRPARMRSLLNNTAFKAMVSSAVGDLPPHANQYPHDSLTMAWPLPNVWLGTSVEDQDRANLRIPQLLDTPAAVRFLSMEPLLDHVSLFANTRIDTGVLVDWVIVGGESGPGARPMRPSWVRGLRDECVAYDIPFFFKQWGSHDEHGQPIHKKQAGRLLDGHTWDQWPTHHTETSMEAHQ